MSEFAVLGQALDLPCGHQVKNRFFKSAMSEILGTVDHQVSNGLVKLYQRWADGGCGVLVTGNVMVDRNSLGEPRNVVFDAQTDTSMVAKWAAAATANNTDCWVQLNHPGKQSPKAINPDPVSPSAVPLGKGLDKFFNPPRELTEAEILAIIGKYAFAAKMAKNAGFSGVQIHGAHGYLVSQFLSPHHNRRQDQWGGRIENRMRFVKEIYQAIRNEVGADFPVGIKLNSADFQRGGFTEDESTQVIQALDAMGMDLFEISGGNYEAPAMTGAKQSTREREAYFIEFAAKVKGLIKAPVVVTGGFRSAQGMADAVASGEIDMVGIARPLTLHPDMPKQIIKGVDVKSLVKPLTTGVKALDQAGMLEITWYEQQMARIAEGKQPKPNMNVYWSIVRTMTSNGIQAFQKRRA
ncbi:NADH:flavin oxidoreductase/NADH oxidase family protein [Litoribrevibacter euphylliae]|uniref:NADH:flavin oxidoreductase/NADH oxidase family protein n=1 Tax=Litoribrevibacter euphylliae TaxID=1834034 RepID=A0ABV7HF41_9GAMM